MGLHNWLVGNYTKHTIVVSRPMVLLIGACKPLSDWTIENLIYSDFF